VEINMNIPRSRLALVVSLGLGAGLGFLAAVGGREGTSRQEGSVAGIASGSPGSGHPGEENTVQPVTDPQGSIQSIRGIQGIDQVALENLEAVLRMQSRTTDQARGNARTAASLMKTEKADDQDEQIPDAREELITSEGS
jgi:hypothetical protein